jgi:hypothetical protein
MRLRMWLNLLRHLDSVRADASAERVQEATFPHMDKQGRNSFEADLRTRRERSRGTAPTPVHSPAAHRARLAMMGIGQYKDPRKQE